MDLIVLIDSRVKIPATGLVPEFARDLKGAFEYSNPEFYKKQRMGFATWSTPRKIQTWETVAGSTGDMLTIPRGGIDRLRTIAAEYGYRLRFVDATVSSRVKFPPFVVDPKRPELRLFDYQRAAVAACLERKQGIVRAPTGSGKTAAALALISEANERAIVVVRDSNLLDQWARVARHCLGLSRAEIGIVRGGRKYRPGPRLTLALQQSLYSKGNHLEQLLRDSEFGIAIVDECFEGSAPVLMADGSLKCIRDVKEGDVVAVGGKVTKTTVRWYEGPAFVLDGTMVTPEHPVATDRGWLPVSQVCDSDLFSYDPRHVERETVCGLRRADAVSLQGSGSSQVWASGLSGDWRMYEVRHRYRAEIEGRASSDLRRYCLEQGADRQDVGGSPGVRGEAERKGDPPARHRSDQASEGDRRVQDCAPRRTGSSVQEPGADRSVEEPNHCSHSSGQDRSVWGQRAWERNASDASGDRVGEEACANGVRSRAGHSDEGSDARDLVSDRLRERGIDDRGRARWNEPLYREEESKRRGEGLFPPVDWVASSEIPGGRLRRDRARVKRCDVEAAFFAHNLETENGVYVAGGVLVHNCHNSAARTFMEVVDKFPARYRFGFSADERRKDGKEFLVYDTLGSVIFEIDRQELERRKVVTPVTVRLVETDFEADWYAEADAGDRDFQRLLEEMTGDRDRNLQLVDLIVDLVAAREVPLLVFTHRREHARELADRLLPDRRVKCGLLLGGSGTDQERFQEDRRRLERGEIDVAVGTFNAIGQGINMPAVQAGVCATPIGSNRQFFGQVRGRICRASEGKSEGFLYYLEDRRVFNARRRMLDWNDGLVETRERGAWCRVT